MAEKAKVTTMMMKVDLDCDKCRKKIKRVLCCIPQVQSQVYDEKSNTVVATVICCSPEKIKEKIQRKGGKSIKAIEIVPEKPKEKPKEAEKPKEPEKPKATEKPKEAAKRKEAEKPKEPAKPKESEKPKEAEKPKPAPAPAAADPPKPKASEPAPPKALISAPVVQGYPPLQVYPRGSIDYYNGGYYGEPSYYDPYRPQPSYHYGQPVYDSWGSGGGYRGYYVGNKTGQCFSDENVQGCIIM